MHGDLKTELAAGAERRLGSVARLLDQVQARADESDREALDAVRVEVRGAQDELREFAQGIRPPLLGSGGLEAAIPVRASRGTLPVDVDVAVGRLEPAIESAVYFVCAEGLPSRLRQRRNQGVRQCQSRCGGGCRERRGRRDRRREPRGLGLRGLDDRVEALGGSLPIHDGTPGGTVLEARIPVEVGP